MDCLDRAEEELARLAARRSELAGQLALARQELDSTQEDRQALEARQALLDREIQERRARMLRAQDILAEV
jgi:hypothetical protein